MRAAVAALHREPGDVESVALENGWQHQLALPAVAIFGNDGADRLVLPAIGAEPLEGGANVLQHRADAELCRATAAEPQRIVRRMALGHEDAEDLVAAERPRAQRRDDGAVDAAGKADDRAATPERAENLLA